MCQWWRCITQRNIGRPIVELFFVQLLIWRRKYGYYLSWNKIRIQISSFILLWFQHSVLVYCCKALFTCLISNTSLATLRSVPLSTGVSLSKITVLITTCWLQPRGISDTICSPPNEKMRRTEYPKSPRKKSPESIDIHTAIIQKEIW